LDQRHVFNLLNATGMELTNRLYLRFLDYFMFILEILFLNTGNMIEWCMPEDYDLDGVEFKAMVSGSHTLVKDFV